MTDFKNHNDYIWGLIRKSGITLSRFAQNTLGMNSKDQLRQSLSSKNNSIVRIATILAPLGYEVVIQPQTSRSKPKNSYTIAPDPDIFKRARRKEIPESDVTLPVPLPGTDDLVPRRALTKLPQSKPRKPI